MEKSPIKETIFCTKETYHLKEPTNRSHAISTRIERWGAGSRPKKMYGERLGDGVEYHLMSPTPCR